MLARPLDLAGKLKPAPRSMDTLFWVNGACLVLFFLLFGSRFVLAPGLGVDFALPEMRGAGEGGAHTTHVISVARPGLIFTDDGALDMSQLKAWLVGRAGAHEHPVLLIKSNASIPVLDLTAIISIAREAGFDIRVAALEPAQPLLP